MEKKHEILIDAISHYIDLICLGDQDGTDEDIETLQSAIEQIEAQKSNSEIIIKINS